MSKALTTTLIALIALASGCVEPTNEFDPDTPAAQQAPGGVTGRLLLDVGAAGGGLFAEELAGVELRLARSDDGATRNAGCEGVTGGEGSATCVGGEELTFSFLKLVPGRYALSIEGLPGRFTRVPSERFEVRPGEEMDLGALVAVVLDVGEAPEGGWTGVVAGQVHLRQSSGGSRRVTLLRQVGDALVEQAATQTNGDGRFELTGLPPGTYALTAELEGFTLDVRSGFELQGAELPPDQNTVTFFDDDALELLPVSAVLRPGFAPVLGGYYTNADTLPLEVLAFGGMTEMRVSTDPGFEDDQTAFVPYSATTSVPLPDVEGPIPAYVQLQNTATSGVTIRSPVYQVTVVRDVTPPRADRLSWRGRSGDADGRVWITEEAAQLTLDIDVVDDGSGLYQVAVSHDDDGVAPDPVELAYDVVDAPPGLVRLARVAGLGAGDGEKVVWVALRDRAGNQGELAPLSAFVDTTPPVVLALVLASGASVTGSATIDVALDAEDENGLAKLALWNEGDPQPAPAPFTSFRLHALAPLDYSATSRQVNAIVWDQAGNASTPAAATIALDDRGSLAGTVSLEAPDSGPPELSGIVALVDGTSHPLTLTAGATPTDPASFVVSEVPQGAGRALVLQKSAYADVAPMVRYPVSPGVVTDVGAHTMRLARGTVEGYVVLDGELNHAGTVIEIPAQGLVTLTDADGWFHLEDVRAGNGIVIVARHGDDYTVESTALTVSAGATTQFGSEALPRVLSPLAGSFSIAGGAFTATPDVTLVMTFDGATQYRASESADFDGDTVSWLPFSGALGSYDFTLSDEDGLHTVYVQFRDPDPDQGFISDARSDVIILDREAPSDASLVIDGGGYIRSLNVTLTISGIDENSVTQFQLAHRDTTDPSDLVAGDWSATRALPAGPFAEPLPGALSQRAVRLWARVLDPAGNTSAPVLAETVLDPDAPVGTSVVITGGASHTSSSAVTLTLAADDASPLEMLIGNAAVPVGGVFEPFATSRSFTLTPVPEGNKSVCVRFRDLAGNVAADVCDEIVLDTVAPSAPSLSTSVGASVRSRAVPIDFGNVTADVTAIELSTSLGFAGSVTSDAQAQVTFTLPDDDGLYAIYARYLDDAGNAGAPGSLSLTLDRVPPDDGSLVLASGQDRVNQRTISATISDSVAARMRLWEVSAGGTCVVQSCDGVAVPFAPVTSVTLSEGTGDKRVCLQLCDDAGNASSPVYDDVALDTYVPRPRPALTSLSPGSYVAFSQSSYQVTAVGLGIASDTQLIVGDFTLACVASAGPSGTSCAADPDGGCGSGGPCEATCATACTATLPDEVMRYSGSYVVRLTTAAPVTGGQSTSAESRFFTVVAPLPKIARYWPRGAEQIVDDSDGSLIAQDIEMQVFGESWMDNVLFRLGSNYATVLPPGVVDDPTTGLRTARIVVSTEGLFDASGLVEDLPTETTLAVVNAGTGGGEARRPFGLHARIDDWSEDTVSTQRSPLITGAAISTAPNAHALAFGLPRTRAFTGAAWLGQSGVARLVDVDRSPLGEFSRETAPGSIPLPLSAPYVDQLDTLRVGRSAGLADFDVSYGAGGDGTFPSVTPSPGNVHFERAAIEDLNGDGWLDLVWPDSNSNTIGVAVATGMGMFQLPDSYAGLNSNRDVALADFDGDGILDMASAGVFVSTIAVRLGLGDGTFGARSDVSMAGAGWFLCAADFDGDGAPDIGSGGGYKPGNGDGTFSDTVPFDSHVRYELTAADLNGDGWLDVFGADTSDRLVVLLNDGTGQFLPAVPYPGYTRASSADVDNDGAIDIVATAASNYVTLLNDGSGSFTVAASSPRDNDDSVSIALVDVTSDGVVDLVHSGSQTAAVRPGAGDGSFGTVIPSALGIYTAGGADVADLNRDGAPDFLNGGALAFGSPSASFNPVTVVAHQSVGSDSGAAADMDRDGYVDFVATGSQSALIYRGSADGTLSATTAFTFPSYLDRPHDLASGDLDGDGLADVAAAIDADLGVLLGDGDGALAAPSERYDLGSEFTGRVVVEDFSGDGQPDVVIGLSATDQLVYFPGEGDGTLGAPSTYPVTGVNGNGDLVSADLDNDGALDLFTAQRVFWGDGGGAFVEGDRHGVSSDEAALADLDGDGWVDLVNNFSTYLTVRWNDGGRAFSSTQNLVVGGFVGGVVAADLNGDGFLDLAATDRQSDRFFVALGDGARGFSTFTTELNAGDDPSKVDVGDVDGDGALDLIAALGGNGILRVLPLGIPGRWTRSLRAADLLSPTVPAGDSADLVVRDVAHRLSRVSVNARLDFAAAPAGTVGLTLVAPDGTEVALGEAPAATLWRDLPGATVHRSHALFHEGETSGDLSVLYGAQPAGEWTLRVDNQTDLEVVVDFSLHTEASLHPERRGSRPDFADLLPLPSGTSGRAPAGTTEGLVSRTDLSCAATGESGEHWYELTLPASNTLSLSVDASFNAALEVREGPCSVATVVEACDANSGFGVKPAISSLALPAGSYCVVVDGEDEPGAVVHGRFRLLLSLASPIP